LFFFAKDIFERAAGNIALRIRNIKYKYGNLKEWKIN